MSATATRYLSSVVDERSDGISFSCSSGGASPGRAFFAALRLVVVLVEVLLVVLVVLVVVVVVVGNSVRLCSQ